MNFLISCEARPVAVAAALPFLAFCVALMRLAEAKVIGEMVHNVAGLADLQGGCCSITRKAKSGWHCVDRQSR